MNRIEEDTAVRDSLVESWDGERALRVIRSHRAPRVWLRRHTRAVVALAAATLALGGSVTATAGAPIRAAGHTDALVAPTSPEYIELPESEVTNTQPERDAEGRASRSERREVRPPRSRSSSVSGATPRWVAPLLGKLRVTDCYGVDRGDHRHSGLDLDGETGDVVRSVGVGRVVQVGYRFGGAGMTVTVQYDRWLVVYAHLSATSVGMGASVRAGQKLGEVGSTGNSTGSHLHLGVGKTTSLGALWDRMVNPVPWLEARGVVIPGC